METFTCLARLITPLLLLIALVANLEKLFMEFAIFAQKSANRSKTPSPAKSNEKHGEQNTSDQSTKV